MATDEGKNELGGQKLSFNDSTEKLNIQLVSGKQENHFHMKNRSLDSGQLLDQRHFKTLNKLSSKDLKEVMKSQRKSQSIIKSRDSHPEAYQSDLPLDKSPELTMSNSKQFAVNSPMAIMSPQSRLTGMFSSN